MRIKKIKCSIYKYRDTDCIAAVIISSTVLFGEKYKYGDWAYEVFVITKKKFKCVNG